MGRRRLYRIWHFRNLIIVVMIGNLMTLKTFCYDGIDTVIAESVEDAKTVLKEMGCYTEDYEENEWVELSGNEQLTLTFEDERDDPKWPENATISKHRRAVKITATIENWIKWNGRGFLCSTEW